MELGEEGEDEWGGSGGEVVGGGVVEGQRADEEGEEQRWEE